ncbi:putative FMN-dependent luciferase-like monooxygenase [Saxibacter everestensis]|uniref:FMN-dependent luciferase-like monooxygenase n=1 Tax=Saxibacter everestensis TaxID=2909229 RepID=A0ABY8QRH7_9MICO|nr:putative FMN-dependent luciferase-like monooxygenase [Brevibacteriaceae bacterium ZFBP1038]
MSQPRIGFFSRLLDDVSPSRRYTFATEQIQQAERHGFASAWVAQHHFKGSEGGLPAPLVFLAHVAARTTSIRLGTGIITLPLEDPIRVAEDASVVDLLSGGRLELGFGSGGTPASFQTFGLNFDDRREIFAGKLQVLADALDGNDFGAGEARVYPAASALSRRLWQATFSESGATRAGERGDGLMLSRTQPRPKDNQELSLVDIQNPMIDRYLESLAPGVSPRILSSRTLFVADDRSEALRFADAGLRNAVASVGAFDSSLADAPLAEIIAATDTHVGTPDDVIESLSSDSSLDRVTDITFQVHSVDPPHEHILRSIELIAHKVAPHFGWRLERPLGQQILDETEARV